MKINYLIIHILFLPFLFVNFTAANSIEDNLQRKVKQFDAYIEEQLKSWQVSGMAIGIVKGDQILLSKGYGQRGLNDNSPVDENTIFQIGSLSKAFTAALIAIDEQNGKLNWEIK